jgi:hypothetical protein
LEFVYDGGLGKKCLDLSGGDVSNGNQIEVWGCNNVSNQVWRFSTATVPTKVIYNASQAFKTLKCMDVKGGNCTNGAEGQ